MPLGKLKPGPKPKDGPRYPSGDLKPVRSEIQAPPTALVNARVLAMRKAVDPRLGTVIGSLWLAEKITRQEYAAGCAYARLRGKHDRTVGYPPRSTLSVDYGAVRAGSEPEKEASDEDVEAVRAEHRSMKLWIVETLPESWCAFDGNGGARPVSLELEAYAQEKRADRIVYLLDRVLVDDLSCEWSELKTLRLALQRLALWFDIES